MIDVFIATSGKREDLFRDVWAWWRAAIGQGPQLHILNAGDTLRGFDAWRRRQAEHRARSEVYILTDDDVLPVCGPSDTAIFDLVTRMGDRRIAQLSAWLDNEPLQKIKAAGADYGPIMTSLESGGLRVRRKGVWTEIPETPAPYLHFDEWDGAIAREKGYVVGYLRDWHALHIGKFRSEQWTEGGEALEHARAAQGAQVEASDAAR